MCLGVALGAFGAHALRGKLDTYHLGIYQTGVLYHFIHALGLFVVAWLSTSNPHLNFFWPGILLIGGIVLFSGSLYLLAITGARWLGAVTPLGGLAFIAAWLLVVIRTLSR